MNVGVVIFTNIQRLGGDATHVKNLLEQFQQQGLVFDVFHSQLEYRQWKWGTLNLVRKLIGRFLVLLRLLTKRNAYSIFYLRDWAFAYLLSWFGFRYAFEVNGLFVFEGLIRGHARSGSMREKALTAMERRVAQRAHQIVCVSEGMKRYLQTQYGIHPDRILVAPNAANLTVYHDRVAAEPLSIGKEKFVIGWMGSFDAYHGVIDLMDVAAGLRQRGIQDVIFLIIGDGPGRREIEATLQQKQLDSYFLFTGFKPWDAVPAVMQNADVCLSLDLRTPENLAYRDTIGVTTIKVYEYLALGKPILAYDLGDAKTFFEGQKIGWICRPEVDSLLQRIIEIKNHPEEVKAFGQNAALLAKERYNWPTTIRSIIYFLKNDAEKN